MLIQRYSIHSAGQLCEQPDQNVLLRWFLDTGSEEPTFDPSMLTEKHDRLVAHGAGKRFFDEVVRAAELTSGDGSTQAVGVDLAPHLARSPRQAIALHISEPAALELAEAARWYEQQPAGLGSDLVELVAAAIDPIRQHSEIGSLDLVCLP